MCTVHVYSTCVQYMCTVQITGLLLQVRSVLYAEKDKKRKERENLPITSLPVEMLAAQV